MAWSEKRKPDLKSDLDLFVSDLCTQWGFCNQPNAEELIAVGNELSADAFAVRVLTAEGMNPKTEIAWRRRIRNCFIDRYGSSTCPQTYSQPPC